MRRSVIRWTLLVLLLAVAGCTLETEPPPPPDLPTVQFVRPANNARFILGTDVTIDLYATDDNLGVVRIELKVDGFTVRDIATQNYQALSEYRVETNWVAQGPGLHSLSAIAYRSDGTQSDEQYLSIEVVTE